ncbi:leptin receptor gene-related protein-like isoform X1 [Eriocheir sinensis]|uniref:Leptin receptor protein n=1 Tax=Eriocheir sinensis TaxID=95602 RepID=E9K6D5_ERISI|nr:leptin receptor gene-related protein-like isoform X1 [Eriocheir sinensis]ADV57398.1 leptin receptor protein [Eriocheir sinensis]ADV57399.1 leptin receptor protein [Eriocheir sinensis]
MAGLKALVTLAFATTIGLTFLFLACALPQYNNWWPFFVVVFYVLAPIPSIIARRVSEDTGGSNPCKELAYFVTAAIVVSAFGLPIVLARSPSTAPVIDWGACGLVLAGNVVTFFTIWGFFMIADSDDVEYSMW